MKARAKPEEESPWDWGDKTENAAEKACGKGKEAAGAATGDESLRTEAQADQAKGDMKQAGQKVKDAFKKD